MDEKSSRRKRKMNRLDENVKNNTPMLASSRKKTESSFVNVDINHPCSNITKKYKI